MLQINIIELEAEDGPFAHGAAYANKYLRFAVDPGEYRGKVSLRCRGAVRRGREARIGRGLMVGWEAGG